MPDRFWQHRRDGAWGIVAPDDERQDDPLAATVVDIPLGESHEWRLGVSRITVRPPGMRVTLRERFSGSLEEWFRWEERRNRARFPPDATEPLGEIPADLLRFGVEYASGLRITTVDYYILTRAFHRPADVVRSAASAATTRTSTTTGGSAPPRRARRSPSSGPAPASASTRWPSTCERFAPWHDSATVARNHRGGPVTTHIPQSDAEWRERLTPAQYEVLRRAGTEPPWSGRYVYSKERGMYACAACGAELFSSETKFDSGSGWPSFTEPADAASVELLEDRSHGMRRVEVRCRRCGSHLGHVFPDGPRDAGGLRYCINSLALDLQPEAHEGSQAG
jgi:peptide-methionine (R)-S-oxide reductase